MKKIITIYTFLSGFLFVFVSNVSAQALAPDVFKSILEKVGVGGENVVFFGSSRVQSLVLLGLVGLVLAGVVYMGLAALRYIRSQGDAGEVESAGKGGRAILMGFAMMMIGIVGFVLIYVFLGAEFFAPAAYQTCIEAANSQGCIACKADDGGVIDNFDSLKFTDPGSSAVGSATGSGPLVNVNRCSFCEWGYFSIANGEESDFRRNFGTSFSTYCEE